MQLELCLLVVCDCQDILPAVSHVTAQMAEPFGEDACLAGPGGGDHPGWTRAVVHRSELISCEVRRGRSRTWNSGERSVHDRLGVDDDCAADLFRTERTTWTTVDPGRLAVRQDDVACMIAAVRGADAAGLAAPPPDELTRSRVIGVRPHEMVQAIEPGLIARTEGPRLGDERNGFAEGCRVDREFDHDRLATAPRLVQPAHRRDPDLAASHRR